MSFEERRRNYMIQEYLAFTVMHQKAFICITGIADGPGGLEPINLGRLWTRHSAGMIELERDRRRRG